VAAGSNIVACVAAGDNREFVEGQHHMEAIRYHDPRREDPDDEVRGSVVGCNRTVM
jgi:hypothetical protein